MDTSAPSSDPFHGLNPADLMAAAAMPTDGGADTLPLSQLDLPSMAEMAAAFPDLEILDLIGHGGMSAVFRARQPKLDRIIALKVLPKSLAATPGFAERFTREGRVLARLSHANIVTVHDFGASGGFCFLIMEYVDGVNLRQAMRAGRFTPEQALNIIPVMCDALQYAHSQGVLHRDIKPENILLDAKGKVKIVDFGIAKILDEKGGDAMMLTQSGVKLGTAPYMAPEQIEKPGSVDHRADIYSLGVVFYEMLTGELPLGRFAAPSEKSDVNGNMDEVVFRALAKDRAMRQQSAGEFKTQIEGIASMPPQMRRTLAWQMHSFEYKSKRMLFGRPLLHVTSGIDPATGRKRVARGIFAFGDHAIGVVAFGGYARGLFACGGLAVGGVAVGGMAVGLVSWGGVALAWLLAYGGLGVGFFAAGGIALGWEAVGGLVACVHGYGGQVYAFAMGMGSQVHAPYVTENLAFMPGPLQWLVKMTRVTGPFVTWIWLPLMLPSLIMPWWARRHLEFEAQGGVQHATVWYERPSRVLWILPGSLLLLLTLVWTTQRWTHPGQAAMNTQSVIATALEILGSLFAQLSLPLWLRLVPVNSLYGVRLPSTLASERRWYEVNAVFGRNLFMWSLMVIAAGIAGFYQLPRHQDAYAWAAVTLTLFSIAASVGATLWWMRQNPEQKPGAAPAARPKRNRLLQACGQVMIAGVIALFIKCFIAAPYKIAGGAEEGVSVGSHWLVSRLDTGFSAGDLVVYQHEGEQYWIARVVKVEGKGLLLKRSGHAEAFLAPWDKIAGKMLFAHFSPAVSKSSASLAGRAVPAGQDQPKGWPLVETTAHAPQEMPRLLYLRMVPEGQPWGPAVHDMAGQPVTLNQEEQRIIKNTTTGQISHDPSTRWLQAWIQHPDLDEASLVYAQCYDGSGRSETAFQNSYTQGFTPAGGPVHSVVLRIGAPSQLPRTVELRFAYSVGPWGNVTRVDKDPELNISTDDWLNGGVGEDEKQHGFVTWLKRHVARQIQCVACLKDGARYAGMVTSTSSASGEHIIERAVFGVRLDEVDHFELRARDIRHVAFKDVVVPPLQKAEVVVEVFGKSSSLPWVSGLTVGPLLKLAGWTASVPVGGKPKKVRWFHQGRSSEIEINATTCERAVDPGDRIIIPE